MQFSGALDDAASFRLGLVVERLVRWLRAASSSAPDAISSSTASTLGRLQQDGPMRITRLAEADGISQPAMTQLVDRLVRAGLARRTTADGDRRCVLVEITASGAAAIDDRRRRRSGHLHDLMQGLAREDQAAIVAALPALERLTDSATDSATDTATDWAAFSTTE